MVDGKLEDTGKNHFGAVVSNNSSIGAAVIIMPVRKILPNTMIPAGTIYKKLKNNFVYFGYSKGYLAKKINSIEATMELQKLMLQSQSYLL